MELEEENEHYEQLLTKTRYKTCIITRTDVKGRWRLKKGRALYYIVYNNKLGTYEFQTGVGQLLEQNKRLKYILNKIIFKLKLS